VTATFRTLHRDDAHSEAAPDGSSVRVLLRVPGGAMTQFALAAGTTSRAVVHRTVDEIWLVLSGRGELSRRDGAHEEVVAMAPGLCVTIPVGTAFQFRARADAPLVVVAATLPPWPGDHEALAITGRWPASSDG
jgi:mannose-6-phosphate isomerase-like protein (cupin superfamily)